MKKSLLYLASIITSIALLAGCDIKGAPEMINLDDESEGFVKNEIIDENGSVEEIEITEAEVSKPEADKCELEDGVYIAEFDTDNSMFHVNEMCDGKGELTVKDGQMTIHVSLTSKKIVNLYYGLAEDARKEGAELLEPSVDVIDYNDGTTDEVHGFDIPVPYLDDEFDVALVGTKGTWYDHKVSVSNPVLKDEEAENKTVEEHAGYVYVGDHTIEVDLEGGSGKAAITSPAQIKTGDDGSQVVLVEWSSPNYDYMLVGEEKYLPVNPEGENSIFEIPVANYDEPLEVIADTVAMSKPHEIEYTLIFHSDTMKEVE
ncbi:MAG: hypothetical protein J6X97_08095 [Lachnospiraceae bacterium]|nr:hypothetical protein [Lachnospiraceae bacterium]